MMKFPAGSTFDTFVESASSSAACRLARGVVRAAGETAVLGVIHGGPGSGKTHLLHAAANAVRQRVPAAEVLYATAGDLASELVAALRTDSAAAWEARYAAATLLLVDDVHDLAGKPATQRTLAAVCARLVLAGASVLCGSAVGRGGLREFADGVRSCRARWARLRPFSQRELQELTTRLFAIRGGVAARSTVRRVAGRSGGDVRRIIGAAVQVHAASRLPSAASVVPWMKRAAVPAYLPDPPASSTSR